jgi:glycosyltransferase involved in cell wall biosynthesis
MIYLDVTGGCLLPLQSGIPRTTRNVYRLLEEHCPGSVPVAWQPFRIAYTRLSPRASAILENRFTLPPGTKAPRDSTMPFLAACLRELTPPWPACVPLRREMQGSDKLLITSLFPDNRLEYLLKLCEQPGRRIALFHDAIPLVDPNVPAWEKKRHIKLLQVHAAMDVNLSVSNVSRQVLQGLWEANGIKAAPVEVLPVPPHFDRARPAYTPPPESANVLYVGRLKQVKNHATLLAACEKLWIEKVPFSLTLIGCEDEARESAAIIAEIKRLQDAGRPLTWRAQVSEDELHAAYQASSFTAFASRHEGFGSPIVESLWHGRPVICSATGAMGEVSAGAGTVHVDVEDTFALAAAMRGLLVHREQLLQLSQAAFARPHRTWTDYWRDLEPFLT